MHAAERSSPGEAAVLYLAAGLIEAIRAFGWLPSLLLYAYAMSTVGFVFWLCLLAG